MSGRSLHELHKSNLSKIKTDKQLREYMLKTGDILADYYNGKYSKDLKHQYLMLTDIDYRIKHSVSKMNTNCEKCCISRLFISEESRYVCTNCGETEFMVSNLAEYSPTQHNTQQNHYTRITYLKERLNQLQSREITHIPDSIITIIKTEMFRAKVMADNCTTKHILNIMKKNKLHKYYPHIQQIYCTITGSQPISISEQTEQKIIQMFKQIEQVFDKIYSDNSKFLNYSYVLNKLFNMINMPHVANCFPLLKGINKLRKHDYMFYKICKELKWKFL